MARRWYGSLDNRLEENRMFTDEIKVGTGMTEYSYSDRDAYEVVAVRDQKHVSVREYDHKHVGDGEMDNRWELISNPDNPVYDLEKRGKYWYFVVTWTAEDLERCRRNAIAQDPENGEVCFKLDCALVGLDIEMIMTKGKQVKRRRANVSFGVADYYYDYSF